MAITTETIKKYTMPCAVLRRIVAFPGIPMTIDMDKGPAKKILETAAKEGSPVFLVCQKNPLEDVTDIDDVYTVGVITKIKQVVKTQSGLFPRHHRTREARGPHRLRRRKISDGEPYWKSS